MNYKIVVVSEPYHYYENCSETRDYLTQIFSNQLRGYKAYYENGVCPISEYDFFTNHIAILDRETDKVLCSYKIMSNETCLKYNKIFPLFKTLGEAFPEHTKIVRNWLEDKVSVGYNHSWTIDPSLSKDVKKELVDITFASLASFYREHKIMNIIDISIMPMKIHKIKEWMGNKYLADLPPFMVEDYGNKLGCIMVNEGLVFSEEFTDSINKYRFLYNSKTDFSVQTFQEKTKKVPEAA